MSVDPKSNYYDAGGIETLAIIKAKLSEEEYIGFLLGNVIKYSTRLNHKGTPERDSQKLAFYSAQIEAELNPAKQTPLIIRNASESVKTKRYSVEIDFFN